MKKLIKIVTAIIILFGIMFAEYRFIMCNIRPYLGKNNTVYLEIFDQVDTYYAEDIME